MIVLVTFFTKHFLSYVMRYLLMRRDLAKSREKKKKKTCMYVHYIHVLYHVDTNQQMDGCIIIRVAVYVDILDMYDKTQTLIAFTVLSRTVVRIASHRIVSYRIAIND